MEIRLFLFPFFWFFAAHQALGEVTTQGGLKSNVVAPELTCQETFKRNSCQDQIDKAGGNRNDFLDCSKKPSILNSTTTCSAHLALGAGVSALTLAAPAVVLPVVGGLVTYNALRSEEVCFHDLEYKKKVVRPLAALHSVEYADALAKRLPCAELERLVVSSIKVHSGQIFEKEQNQQRFDKELARRPDQKAHLERIYPAQNRLLTANEIEFKTVLEQIKSEETQLISLVEKINKNFHCCPV